MKKLFSKRHAGWALLGVAVIVVAVVQLMNLLPALRLDLTEGNMYTLSDGTKHMLKSMEKTVTAELFYSADATSEVPQIANYAQRVQELLHEYERLSGGKLKLKITSPDAFSEDEDRANELGLISVPLTPGGAGIWFGLAVTGEGGKPETIAFFRPDHEESLEYDLSQVVWKASRHVAPKIALATSLDLQGGFDFMTRQPTPPWASFAQLQQLYNVEALAPDFERIGDDVRLLLIAHPGKLQEKSLHAIDRWVRGGGATLVFVDPNAEAAGGGMFGATDPSSNIAPLFAAWGVQYDPTKVVGDASLAVPVASEQYGRPVPNLTILQFGQGEFPTADPVTARLERLLMASPGALSHAKDSASTFTPLIESSDQAELLDATRVAAAQDHTKLYEGFKPTGERYVLAARITGKINSAFPAPASGASVGPVVEEKSANILVVADSDVLSDRLWVNVQDFMGQQVAQAFADNGDFLTNSVDGLMGSSDLADIRGRGRYERPFDKVNALERAAAMNLQAKQQTLEDQLTATEEKLTALQAKKQQDAKAFELDAAQVAELEKFMAEKLRVRKELREVQHQLGSDIDTLGAWLKFINIVLMPLLLVLMVFGIARWRLARD